MQLHRSLGFGQFNELFNDYLVARNAVEQNGHGHEKLERKSSRAHGIMRKKEQVQLLHRSLTLDIHPVAQHNV